MARRSRNLSTSARWLVGVLVSALAIGTIVLSVAALGHVRTTHDGDAAPVPTFTLGSEPSASAAPSPTETPDAVSYPRSEERFLAAGTGTIWRATAGECGVVEPLLERSTDGGESWTDVTPRYRGIGQVVSLDAFAGTEAEMVARMGPDCELQALRTFTQGEFWESYPDVLAASRYVDPANPSQVILAGEAVAAPCPDPRSFRAAGVSVALVCGGEAFVLDLAGAWAAAPVADVRAAAVASDGRVLTASVTQACPGLTVTFIDDQSVVCAGESVQAGAIGVTATDAEIFVWSGESLTMTER